MIKVKKNEYTIFPEDVMNVSKASNFTFVTIKGLGAEGMKKIG
jgi:hypothetical protein